MICPLDCQLTQGVNCDWLGRSIASGNVKASTTILLVMLQGRNAKSSFRCKAAVQGLTGHMKIMVCALKGKDSVWAVEPCRCESLQASYRAGPLLIGTLLQGFNLPLVLHDGSLLC